jgi:aminotransferase
MPTSPSPASPRAQFCERLLREARVMAYPGTIYGDYVDNYVRLSLTQPVPKIEEAIERMRPLVAAIRAETVAA